MRIKICHLSSAHKWYDERIFQKECKSLARAGYQVSFVVTKDYPETIDLIKLIPLPAAHNRLMRFLLMGIILLRALKERASLYHFHDPELIIVGLFLKLFGKKVIYDAHEDYINVTLSREWIPSNIRPFLASFVRLAEKIASRIFDYIIVVDSNNQSKFPPSKTERITNAPPKANFLSKSRNRPDNGQFRLVFIGAVTEVHGAKQMLDAVKLSRHKGELELHLIGTIPEVDLQTLCKENPQVISHGRVSWEKSQQMLADADVGLLLYLPTPAHLHITGEGNTKLFEYMACGLPVIYSDFPKLRSLIDLIGCGIPVDPTDPKKIAETIDKLYESPDLRAVLGEKGRLAVRDQFNWENEEQKLLKVYERVLLCN